MKETFERVIERRGKVEVPIKHLYRRQYQTAGGDWRTIYYAIFTDWKGKRRKFPLGSHLGAAKEVLALYQGRNIKRGDKIKAAEGMTVASWADCYWDLEETKTKRSFKRERDLVAAIKRLLGSVLITGIQREHLFKYRTTFREHIIRAGKQAAKTVSPGTVANKLSCLRHMLNKARENEHEAATPSFAGLMQRRTVIGFWMTKKKGQF